MSGLQNLRIAVVHDWLISFSGAEKVLQEILALYPKADVFCLLDFLPQNRRGFLHGRKVQTSFLQRIPYAKKIYRLLTPLMPLAVEQLDLRGYDLILSSSHAVAKGVISGPNQLHIAYVHTPMRYAWDLQAQYLEETGLAKQIRGIFARSLLHYLRMWDYQSSARADYMIANSNYTRRRIQRAYRREASVIYPPVATDYFCPGESREDFYLTVGRLVPYKKTRILVEAFSEMPDKKLVVIGDGPQASQIKKLAAKNVVLLGYQPDEVVREYMQRAKAFVFAAEEDFGITPLEAQACGTPVISLGHGGCFETIVDVGCPKPTGVFFQKQEKECFRRAISQFEMNGQRFSVDACRENAARFSADVFKERFSSFAEKAWREFCVSENPSLSEGSC